MEYEIHKVDELTHWGIKGMRWGVRRYQNKDGSLTPRGKKRYEAELKKVREQEKVLKTRQATRAKLERLEARKKAAADEKAELDELEGKGKKSGLFKRKQKSEEAVSKKRAKDMSDVELYEAINRARMEDTYNQLRPEKVEKQKMFGSLVNDVVKPAATNAGKQFLENALKQAGSKLLEGKVDPNSIEALTKMRDKLKLKNEIKKLEKNDPDDDRTWKDREEELEYKRAKEKYDAEKKATAEKASEAARKANEKRSLEEYEKTGSAYRHNYNVDKAKTDVGERYVQSSNTQSRGIAGLLGSPEVNTGRRYLESTPEFELLDGDGNVISRYRRS